VLEEEKFAAFVASQVTTTSFKIKKIRQGSWSRELRREDGALTTRMTWRYKDSATMKRQKSER